jgi:uncharacterized coiled-coil protein SlyX
LNSDVYTELLNLVTALENVIVTQDAAIAKLTNVVAEQENLIRELMKAS